MKLKKHPMDYRKNHKRWPNSVAVRRLTWPEWLAVLVGGGQGALVATQVISWLGYSQSEIHAAGWLGFIVVALWMRQGIKRDLRQEAKDLEANEENT